MNTQPQNTLPANSEIKSAAQASCKSMCVEGVKIGEVFVASWGYEQTNVDFYQVIGLTAKSVRLRAIAQERTADGYTTPIENKFIGDVFTRRYDNKHKHVKIADYSHGRIWNGKPQHFTCYA